MAVVVRHIYCARFDDLVGDLPHPLIGAHEVLLILRLIAYIGCLIYACELCLHVVSLNSRGVHRKKRVLGLAKINLKRVIWSNSFGFL